MGSKLCLPVYVKPLKGIQHSTLACNVYYVHYIIHRTKCMTFFYDVLDKLRLIVYVFIVSVMLSESHVERTTSLSNILFFGHVNWYTQFLSNFGFWVSCISKSFLKLLLVVYATFKDVFFKCFVMYLVSLPTYVKLTHLWFWVSCSYLCLCFVFLPILFRSDVLYLLLLIICFTISISFCFCRWLGF